jgi:sarcosine oxidase delta subunit
MKFTLPQKAQSCFWRASRSENHPDKMPTKSEFCHPSTRGEMLRVLKSKNGDKEHHPNHHLLCAKYFAFRRRTASRRVAALHKARREKASTQKTKRPSLESKP